MSLNRRLFLSGAAALASAPALGAVSASGETDVAIVGAGAAGIAAARKIAAAGRRFASPEAIALYRLNALDASVKGALEHGLSP